MFYRYKLSCYITLIHSVPPIHTTASCYAIATLPRSTLSTKLRSTRGFGRVERIFIQIRSEYGFREFRHRDWPVDGKRSTSIRRCAKPQILG